MVLPCNKPVAPQPARSLAVTGNENKENREIVPSVSYDSLFRLCASGLAALAILTPLIPSMSRSSWSGFTLWFSATAAATIICAFFTFDLLQVYASRR